MIQGWDKLERNLAKLVKANYTPALQAGVEKEIFPEMQALTPVDTGDLLESERVEVENDTVLLVADSDHAVHVEFGTIHQSAQSFMRAAIDTKSKDAMKVAGDEAFEIMKKVTNG